jgi:general secretion pathway protein G
MTPAPFDRSKHGQCLAGITLIELVIIVAIVATLAGICIPAYDKYRETTRTAQAVLDIRAIEHDLLIQESFGGGFPTDLSEVNKGDLRDPWGNYYQYYNPATGKGKGKGHGGEQRFDKLAKPLNTDFDLYSMGKDGQSKANLDSKVSLDDIVRGLNGQYLGLASEF